jgi:hypothetical protein
MGQRTPTGTEPHNMLSDPKEETLLGFHAPQYYETLCNDNHLSSYRDYVNVGSRLERV